MKLDDLIDNLKRQGSLPESGELERWIETNDPALFNLCYPRSYRNIDRWGSPKTPAYGHAFSIRWVRDDYHNCPLSVQMMYVGACMQSQWAFPCYFAERELLDAVSMTDVPEGIRWMDPPLPYEAGNLILPRDYVKTPAGEPIEFISWARARAGEVYQWANYHKVTFAHNHLLFYTFLRNTNGLIYDTNLSEHITPFIPKISAQYWAGTRTGIGQLEIDEEESLLIARLRDLTLGLFLILECRPQLVTEGQRAIGIKRKKSHREMWEPTIIGKNFRIRSEKSDSQHKSPRLHWVGGHLKPNLSERLGRRVWIEPYERGGAVEDE
jgi:hypothetical protein